MRTKLIHPPKLYDTTQIAHSRVHHHFPLLSLPTLVSYLRQNGFHADQDDLDIRYYSLWINNSAKTPDLSAFANDKRILAALENPDEELMKGAEKCLKMTRTKGYDVIGFSVVEEFNLGELGTAIIMAKLLREKHDPFIVLSGTGISTNVYGNLIAAASDIDALMAGPHFNAYNLLTLLENGERPPSTEGYKQQVIKGESIVQHHARMAKRPFWKKIAGRNIHSGVQHELKSCNPKHFSADEHFPIPCFDGLPLDLYRFSSYDVPDGKPMLILPYKYLYGCQNRCAFCSLSKMGFHTLKSPDTVAEELEYLSRKHRTTNFFFMNANCNPSKNFVEELAHGFNERDLHLKWTDCANFMALDRKTLQHLRDAGAVRLIYGLESASDRMLRYVGKPLTTRKVEKLLRISHELGIWNDLEIITGIPHETEHDLQCTTDFLMRNRKVIDYFHLNMFHLSNQSRMYFAPEHHDITNVREDPKGVGHAFDEIGGLTWEESLEQRKMFFDRLISLREKHFDLGYFGLDDSFLKMFYLSVEHDDKSVVREILPKSPSIYGASPSINVDKSSESLYYRLPDDSRKSEVRTK